MAIQLKVSYGKFATDAFPFVYSISKRDNDFVHMPSGLYIFIMASKFNGPFRITFRADAPAVLLQVQQGKHLTSYLEYQCCIIEWKAFCNSWLRNAIFSYFFVVHNRENTGQMCK